jgi:hypothetical protein
MIAYSVPVNRKILMLWQRINLEVSWLLEEISTLMGIVVS